MRKIQFAISSNVCIKVTWNLTGSCGQQHRLSWVVSYDGKTIPRWRTAPILKIAISQRKIIRFRLNFVHSSRFWTGWKSRDQKWNRVALDRLRVRQNVLLVYYYNYHQHIICLFRNCQYSSQGQGQGHTSQDQGHEARRLDDAKPWSRGLHH